MPRRAAPRAILIGSRNITNDSTDSCGSAGSHRNKPKNCSISSASGTTFASIFKTRSARRVSPGRRKRRKCDALQQQIEVEPLNALLGREGQRAYFDYEGSTFYRALVEPFVRKLALFDLPLTDDQTTRLVALAQANMRSIKPDPTSMGSEIAVDWAPVLTAAADFVDPKQLALMRAQADRLTKSK